LRISGICLNRCTAQSNAEQPLNAVAAQDRMSAARFQVVVQEMYLERFLLTLNRWGIPTGAIL
jgi:hypothetical protein